MHITISAETIFYIGSFPVTNALIMSWIAIGIILVLGLAMAHKPRTIPHGLQNAGEMILDTGLQFCTSVMGSRKNAEKVFPLIATLFLFILVSNWIGLLPGVGTITLESAEHHGTPLLRPANADLNMTLALSIIAVLATHLFGIIAIGARLHIKKFLNFSSPLAFFVGILELFGEISKMVSFSFRLFGNIFAGEVLLVVIFFLLPVIAPIPFMGLEIFVGFIQALVFSMLTMVFLQVAMAESEH